MFSACWHRANGRASLFPRTIFLLAAIFAVDALIAESGGLPSLYSYFFFVVLMYAGLALPLPLALSITAIAVIGPSHRGLLFVDALNDEELTVLLRPVAMGAMVMLAWLIARAIRRNVSFYEQLYTSIAAHFPNGTISLFDHSLRFLISGGEGLKQIGLSPDQIVGKQPWDVFDPQALEKELPAMHAAPTGRPAPLR